MADEAYFPGQRWLSEPETDLGLGIIQEADQREVVVFFPACEEERRYARASAPLSRFTHSPGDTLETADGDRLVVKDLEDMNGLLIYRVHPPEEPENVQPLPESQLAHHLSLTTAADRLFSKQLDTPRWFELRYQALKAREHNESSPIQGLRGPRIDLIGHQLHIAHEVAQRFAPRVLLADEVGLGKTIEAGLIIHQQLISHRARRVLIVVPPPLVHQWFVEMARRFNLHFSIFDQSRLDALREEEEAADEAALDEMYGLMDDLMGTDGTADEEAPAQEESPEPEGNDVHDNPFLSEQLVLISTDLLMQCDIEQLAGAEWDLMVVDEAHHLTWSPEAPGEEYQRVETVARQTPGLLLLTATPEQLGRESHFARLRLLDPDRYGSLKQFIEEQDAYQPIADLAVALHDEENWSDSLKKEAKQYLPDMEITESNRDAILAELLDRNGTGRVLFRNTRRNVPGFPARVVEPAPLPRPEIYERADEHVDDLDLLLHPESDYQDDSWCGNDPRIKWLADFLKAHRQDKVLVICARKETAIDVHAHLGYKQGMNVGVFHEDMDLISRDRTAAYFADEIDGAQALICSEIGSEGRNFQFAHHLVLLDLPLNPDLLEQRIGRLDRIGQREDIRIHVPCFEEHAQEVLFRWYHHGMDAFEHTNPAGTWILERTREPLMQALGAPDDADLVDSMVSDTRRVHDDMQSRLEQGRDRLLELSSHDPDKAAELVRLLAEADEETPTALMEQVFERYGVESEYHSEHAQVLMPGPQMAEPFPGLPEEGVTVTDHRPTALARDDMQFLTWEHPMVSGALELILDDTRGKACVSLLKNPKLPAGTLLVEAIYTLECVAPRHLQAQRFLPPKVVRTLIDRNGKDLSHAIGHQALSQQCTKVEKKLARQIVESQKELLEQLLKRDEALAAENAQSLIDEALSTMQAEQRHELNRLKQLREKNPNIRDEEIRFLENQTEQLARYIGDARCQMEAVRVIVTA